jgi:GNAT superfamily N-acetyltransferase
MASPETLEVHIRPLREGQLAEAARIFRLAFGTFIGLPDPMQFAADRDYVAWRWRADQSSAFAAEAGGELIGSNFANNWGSVGFFGPLTIRPDYWDRGIAQRLLEPVMQKFEQWQTRHAGLFTFAQSTKHVHLYQKFGFWPRFLTAIMSKEIDPPQKRGSSTIYSELNASGQEEALKACRELTNAIYDGLDVQSEIRAIVNQKLGDTILLWNHSRLSAFAVCHCGAETEAGKETCYVKFGAARSADAFEDLLDACQAFAHARVLLRLEAGVNVARHDAYRRMLARGFQARVQGVTMHKPNEPGYSRPDVYVMDDWR